MKNKLLFGSALAGLAIAAPLTLSAQQLPPAAVAVVNQNQIAQQCTQCAAALQQLQSQGQQLQARAQQLGTPLQTEEQAIRAAIAALPQGGQPDAALQARIRTFQTNQNAAQNELTGRQETLRRNEAYVLNQIGQRLTPLVQQIALQRGATVTLDSSQVVQSSPAIDITPAVLALMNLNNTPFSTTAPPPAPAPATPTATPAPAQPNRPRPSGR
jgi:Skp family chaperone for outer membrane proteins